MLKKILLKNYYATDFEIIFIKASSICEDSLQNSFFKVNIKIYREKLFLKNRNATVLGITMHPFVAIIDS